MFLVFQIDRGNLRVMITNITSLTMKTMRYKTLMLFLQMSNPRAKKLYCMCFRTMKLWSRWSLKGRSPTMRHVSRTHRVALDWLFDRINLDSKIQIKYIDTENQLADILTKGNCTRDEWNHLLNLFNISHFSSTACTAAMAKRAQQESGEERVTAKSRPMMNLIARTPSFVSSSTSVSYLRNVTDLLSDGKTPNERRFGKPFKGPIIPFGSLVEYHPITAKDQSRIHQFGKKVLPGLFLGYALYAGGIWKGDVLIADIEELETMDASQNYSQKDSMQRK